MLAMLLARRPAHAQVAPELEAAIQLKVLSFDNGLRARAKSDTIVIAVAHGGDRASLAAAADISAGFNALANKKKVTVHGKKLRVVMFAISDDLAQQASGVQVLYVASGVSSDQLAAVARVAEDRKLPTLCNQRSYLSSGLAVGVVVKSDKPSIVVHAGNAKRTGMMLDSKLLRLAEVVK